MQLTHIKDFKETTSIRGFYLCLEKSMRLTRSGDSYLDLVLQDATGRVTARVWDNADHFARLFDIGDPLAVKGTVEKYQGSLQLICSQIALASPEKYARYGYSESMLVPTIDEDPLALWEELRLMIVSVKNRNIKRLLRHIFKDNKEKVLVLPGSLKHHHPVRGGYLKHVVSTGQIALKLAEVDPRFDRDLLLAGTLLHDIGKCRSLKTGLESDYTEEGQLIGHVVQGRDILLDAVSELGKMPDNLVIKLEHMILSHQGSKGYSPRPPRFPEALAAHLIDNMDGQLDLIFREIDEADSGAPFTDNRNHFRTPLWKHHDS